MSRGQKTNLKGLEELRSQNIRACMRVCSVAKFGQLLRPCGLSTARLLRPWDFPVKNTRVGCHFLLQNIRAKTGKEAVETRMRHENYFHGMVFDVKLLSHTKGMETYMAQET